MQISPTLYTFAYTKSINYMSILTSRIYVKGEYKNQTIILPFVGEVTFDKNGDLEVEEVHVQAIVDATKDSFNFKKVGAPDPESGSDDALSEELDEFKAQLDLLSEVELLTLVSENDNLEFKARAAGMSNELIKKELVRQFKEELAKPDRVNPPGAIGASGTDAKPRKKRGPKPKDNSKRDEFIAKVRSGKE